MSKKPLDGKMISILTDSGSSVQGQALRQTLDLLGAKTSSAQQKKGRIIIILYSHAINCKTLIRQAHALTSKYPILAIPTRATQFIPQNHECICLPFELNAILETLLHLQKLSVADNSLSNARTKRFTLFLLFLIVALFPIGFCAHLYPFHKAITHNSNYSNQTPIPTPYPHITLIGHGHTVNGTHPQKPPAPTTPTDHNHTITVASIILAILAYVILLVTTLVGFLSSCRRCRQLKGIEKTKHYLETFDDDIFEKDKENKNEALKRKQKAQYHLLEFYLEESER